MTVLSPEEDEAAKALASVLAVNTQPEKNWIIIAGFLREHDAVLRRHLDEARAECERLRPKPELICEECGLPISECNEIAMMRLEDERRARLEAAERALAEARHVIATARQLLDDGEPDDARDILDADDALPEGEAPVTRHERESFVRQLAEARAKCKRLRAERFRTARADADQWQAAAEGERERIIQGVCPPPYWSDRIRALPAPTIEPSVTNPEKSDA